LQRDRPGARPARLGQHAVGADARLPAQPVPQLTGRCQCAGGAAGDCTIACNESMNGATMLHVIATIELNPGTREAFLAEFRKIVPLVHAEEGCIEYGPTVDATTDLERQARSADTVVIIEKWTTLATLKAHLVAPHMTAYRPKVKDYIRA